MADITTSEKRKREKLSKEGDETGKTSESDEDIGPKKLKTQNQEVKDEIKSKFKLEMPQDFYDFWEFCTTLNANHPEEALKDTLNFELVGPYDVFTGKLINCDESNIMSYHLYWRYYYDPPEFQTILRSCDSNFHIGYFRDDPKSLPVFLASNDTDVGCEMTIRGGNIFGAVSIFLSETLKKCKVKTKKDNLKILQTKITSKASKLDYSLSSPTPSIKSRSKLVNTKTFHKAGMVVPVDASDVGYRPLTVTDGELKRILKKICESKTDSEAASEQLQEIITYIQFANDECDYGMGLELGLDIFCFGEKRFHNLILQLMPLAYNLLGRDLYAEIIEVHLKYRDRENLSVITL